MKLNLIYNPDQVSFSDIINLYTTNGWGAKEDYSEEQLKEAYLNSTFTIFAFEGAQLAGLIRVLSDNITVTWISEILIHPLKQNKGIGSKLISEIISKFGHTSIYAETFLGKEKFFNKNGVKKRDNMVVVSRRKT